MAGAGDDADAHQRPHRCHPAHPLSIADDATLSDPPATPQGRPVCPLERLKHPRCTSQPTVAENQFSVASDAISDATTRNRCLYESLTSPETSRARIYAPILHAAHHTRTLIPNLRSNENDPTGTSHVWQMFISDFLGAAAAGEPALPRGRFSSRRV